MIKENINISSDKLTKIMKASLDEFAKFNYKNAILENIAKNANISKSLILYHFKTKKTLYLYTYNYFYSYTKSKILDDNIYKINDFFELMEYIFYKKVSLIKEYHNIFDFYLKVYFEKDNSVFEDIQKLIKEHKNYSMEIDNIFSNIDKTKFKNETDFNHIIKLLSYATEGYLQNIKYSNSFNIEEVAKEHLNWINILKKVAYKEEYL